MLVLVIVIKREDDDLSGPQVHTRPLIRREPGELEAPAQNTTNLSAATAADSDHTFNQRDLGEEFDFGLERDDADPMHLLLLSCMAQWGGMGIFMIFVAKRQKWSVRMRASRRNTQLDLSKIELVPKSEAPDGDDCVICLGCCEEGLSARAEGLECWRRLPCGHKYHEGCIFEWLRKTDRCPVCRAEVGLKRLTKSQ